MVLCLRQQASGWSRGTGDAGVGGSPPQASPSGAVRSFMNTPINEWRGGWREFHFPPPVLRDKQGLPGGWGWMLVSIFLLMTISQCTVRQGEAGVLFLSTPDLTSACWYPLCPPQHPPHPTPCTHSRSNSFMSSKAPRSTAPIWFSISCLGGKETE